MIASCSETPFIHNRGNLCKYDNLHKIYPLGNISTNRNWVGVDTLICNCFRLGCNLRRCHFVFSIILLNGQQLTFYFFLWVMLVTNMFVIDLKHVVL